MNHILFVCTGNTCRSPMAEGYLKYLCKQENKSNIQIKSAGIGAIDGCTISSSASAVIKKVCGTNISAHKSKQLTESLLNWADIVIAMSTRHIESIIKRFPNFNGKLMLLNEYIGTKTDIFDPFGGSLEIYEDCFNEMKQPLNNLFASLNT